MNIPLFVAGLLALFATTAHGLGGEVWVVRRLLQEQLPATRLGGTTMTKAMVHVAWHITTFAFLAVAVGLILSATVLDGDAAGALAVFCAAAFTGFAAVAIAVGGGTRPRAVVQHPGPMLMAATAALAWWGAAL